MKLTREELGRGPKQVDAEEKRRIALEIDKTEEYMLDCATEHHTEDTIIYVNSASRAVKLITSLPSPAMAAHVVDSLERGQFPNLQAAQPAAALGAGSTPEPQPNTVSVPRDQHDKDSADLEGYRELYRLMVDAKIMDAHDLTNSRSRREVVNRILEKLALAAKPDTGETVSKAQHNRDLEKAKADAKAQHDQDLEQVREQAKNARQQTVAAANALGDKLDKVRFTTIGAVIDQEKITYAGNKSVAKLLPDNVSQAPVVNNTAAAAINEIITNLQGLK